MVAIQSFLQVNFISTMHTISTGHCFIKIFHKHSTPLHCNVQPSWFQLIFLIENQSSQCIFILRGSLCFWDALRPKLRITDAWLIRWSRFMWIWALWPKSPVVSGTAENILVIHFGCCQMVMKVQVLVCMGRTRINVNCTSTRIPLQLINSCNAPSMLTYKWNFSVRCLNGWVLNRNIHKCIHLPPVISRPSCLIGSSSCPGFRSLAKSYSGITYHLSTWRWWRWYPSCRCRQTSGR